MIIKITAYFDSGNIKEFYESMLIGDSFELKDKGGLKFKMEILGDGKIIRYLEEKNESSS